jgi:hypothetical protein
MTLLVLMSDHRNENGHLQGEKRPDDACQLSKPTLFTLTTTGFSDIDPGLWRQALLTLPPSERMDERGEVISSGPLPV